MVNQAPSLVHGHCLAISPPCGAAEQARQECQAYCSPDPSQKQLCQYQFLPDVRLACVSELTALGFDSNDYNGAILYSLTRLNWKIQKWVSCPHPLA